MEKVTRRELMRKIQAYSFAKTETELFLDGHPDCPAALDYYRDTVEKLSGLVEEYENRFGPITARGTRGDGWAWVTDAWPWQKEEV